MRYAGSSVEKLQATSNGGIYEPEPRRKSRFRRPWLWILLAIFAVLAITGAVIGALIGTNVINVHPKSKSSASTGGSGDGSSGSSSGGSSNPDDSGPTVALPPAPCTAAASIPSAAQGTWMDPTSWLDGRDFNCTFTDRTVGNLPVVGLNSTWDDSKRANANVPPLNQPWGPYTSRPIRGINLGGWLSLEPFITPSLFGSDPSVGDEYTLCSKLGPQAAKALLEKHYATFITESDFRAIAAAGLDHVRIPYSYWAVRTYDNDPYVEGVSWRYLLRGIEWARKYGLRIKLDFHGLPGSQNGWNHSGKQGTVGWLAGPNGTINGQRSLDIHDQLSKFFAQPRYKNIIIFYGLVNEPALAIPQTDLIAWNQQAIKIVTGNGVTAVDVIGDAGRGLVPWEGKLSGYGNSLVMDVHLYSIFDDYLIGLKHADRITFACQTWTDQIHTGLAKTGPVMVAEWSQANNDCADNLNGIGNGARWSGTISGGIPPLCPTRNSQCSCSMSNTNITSFSDDYKHFLTIWAEAQMSAFETSWGWFYWTWKTETAPLWSYSAGLDGKILPAIAYNREFNCNQTVPSFGSLPEYY